MHERVSLSPCTDTIEWQALGLWTPHKNSSPLFKYLGFVHLQYFFNILPLSTCDVCELLTVLSSQTLFISAVASGAVILPYPLRFYFTILYVYIISRWWHSWTPRTCTTLCNSCALMRMIFTVQLFSVCFSRFVFLIFLVKCNFSRHTDFPLTISTKFSTTFLLNKQYVHWRTI